MCIRDSRRCVLLFSYQAETFLVPMRLGDTPCLLYTSLNKEDIRKIVTLLLKTLEKRCAEQMEIHLTVTNAVKDFIAEKGSDNKYGARPLRRAIPVSYTHLDVYKRQVLHSAREY